MKYSSFCYCPPDFIKIEIGYGTWLGGRISVVSNVTIGKGCLIAPGCVVTKNVPDFTICGGVPENVIRRIDPETQ